MKAMEAIQPWSQEDQDPQFIAALSAHVVAALDHLTSAERRGVRAAVEAFTRYEQEGATIPGPDPLFVL